MIDNLSHLVGAVKVMKVSYLITFKCITGDFCTIVCSRLEKIMKRFIYIRNKGSFQTNAQNHDIF